MKAQDILAALNLSQGTASKSDIRAIARAADGDDPIIQATEMVALFPGEPTRHVAATLRTALLWAGCEPADSL